jgi:hypothetical protein
MKVEREEGRGKRGKREHTPSVPASSNMSLSAILEGCTSVNCGEEGQK